MSDETRIISGVPGGGRVGLLAPGDLVVNSYRVRRLVATGGMGALYEGEHDITHDRVAIKAILDEHARDPLIAQMFEREAIALKKVRHDAVVGYRDILRDQHGRLFLIMDFVEGNSLSDRLRKGALSERETMALGARLAGGLGAAHKVGVVHRDMSPGNVLLPGGDINRAVIIDFGIAKTLGGEQVSLVGDSFAGKIRYAAPEQLGHFGGKLDHRADIYSVALLLAESVGVQPPAAGNLAEAISIRKHDVILEKAPPTLRARLEPMLRADPDKRPNDFESAWSGKPAATPLKAADGGNRFARMAAEVDGGEADEKGGNALAYALIGLLLIGAIGFFGWMQRDKLFGETEVAGVTDANVPQTPTEEKATVANAPEQPAASTKRAEPPKPPPDPNAASIVQVATAQEAMALGPEKAIETARALQRQGDEDSLNTAFAIFRELAGAGSAEAAIEVARMYDPAHYSPQTSPFSKSSVRSARRWYEKAAELGSEEADDALQRLDNQ